jgi:hypothetical protein
MEVERARDIVQLAGAFHKLGIKLSLGEAHLSMSDEEVVKTAEELVEISKDLSMLMFEDGSEDEPEWGQKEALGNVALEREERANENN